MLPEDNIQTEASKDTLELSQDEWIARTEKLSELAHKKTLQRKDTEPAFSQLWHNHRGRSI